MILALLIICFAVSLKGPRFYFSMGFSNHVSPASNLGTRQTPLLMAVNFSVHLPEIIISDQSIITGYTP